MRTKMLSIVIALLIGLSAAVPVATAQDEETLSLKGCLLLSRRVGIYALHMEYNRVAVTGHADLANHVGHLVTMRGMFETVGDYLQFVVEEITDLAPTCESQAQVTVPATPHV